MIKEDFIIKSNAIHNQKYNYSLIPYNFKAINKVKIICPIHGVFEQRAFSHYMEGRGCSKCGIISSSNKRRFSKDEFIKKSKLKHGEKYIYEKVEYTINDNKVIIICPIHGEFLQRVSDHLDGSGCDKCARKINSIKKTKTKEQFIEKSIIKHGDKYDYSLVEYINNKKNVKIICPIHGVFEQSPGAHYKGGCKKCGCDNTRKKISIFLLEVNKIHDDKYKYPNIHNEYITNRSNISILCPKHGIFIQQALRHKQGCGCPVCNSSKGELKIRKYLSKNNIIFEQQKKFDSCKNKRKLPFDFYLSNFNICIEFDGRSHFESVYGSKSLEKTRINDNIKENWCKENNIKLIRINYIDYKNIENILSENLNCVCKTSR